MDFDQPSSPQREAPRRRSSLGSDFESSSANNNNNNAQRRRSSLDSMSMSMNSATLQAEAAAQQNQQQLRRGSSMDDNRHSFINGDGVIRDSHSNSTNGRSHDNGSSPQRSSNGSSNGSSGRNGNNPLFRPPTTSDDDDEPLDNQVMNSSTHSAVGITQNGSRGGGNGGNNPSSNDTTAVPTAPTLNSNTSSSGPNRRTSMSDKEQAHRRASIQQIMQDGRLSQLEKRRSIQFLMDGRRRSTIDCGVTNSSNPYMEAKAKAARELRRSSFDNGDGESSVASGVARSSRRRESMESLASGGRRASMESLASQSSSMAGAFGNGLNGYGGIDRGYGGIGNGGGDQEDVHMMDMDELDGQPPVGDPRQAAAAWSAYHAQQAQQQSQSQEQASSDSSSEYIHVPNHAPQAAAAIAHASAQTTSDHLAAKHPYQATTTAVPAVAANASEFHPHNLGTFDKNSAFHSSFKRSPPTNGTIQKRRPSSVEVHRRAIETAPPCTHYERKCHIVSPCCGATFGCRICHDDCPVLPPLLAQQGMNMMGGMGGGEMDHNNMGGMGGGAMMGVGAMGAGRKYQRVQRTSSMPTSFENDLGPPEHHNVDRFAIAEIICRECFTKQSSKTNFCINCQVQFGEYHCAICNLWMSNEERPYHCPDCGFCRVGGGENFRHCQDCGMCIDKQLFKDHNCKVGKYMSNCPVCQEDLFSSRDASHELPCGHAIHWHCFRELASHDSRCPMCKKTAETHERMKPTWDAMAMGIALQPVPPELCKVVTIKCNDCEEVQQNRSWHFLGVQCRRCESFNTVVERITMMGQEAHEFLLREDPHPSTTNSGNANANNGGANGGATSGNGAGGTQQQQQSSRSGARRSGQRPRRRRATVAVESSNQAPPPPF